MTTRDRLSRQRDIEMCAAYFVPPGEAGAIAPEFSPSSLFDKKGQLCCVPEHIFGVSLDDDGHDLERSVRRAVHRLQLKHHPDRPFGDRHLSRYASTHSIINTYFNVYRGMQATKLANNKKSRFTIHSAHLTHVRSIVYRPQCSSSSITAWSTCRPRGF